jgi:hypothetical protein
MELLKQKSSTSYGAHLEKVQVVVASDGTITVGNYKLGKKTLSLTAIIRKRFGQGNFW